MGMMLSNSWQGRVAEIVRLGEWLQARAQSGDTQAIEDWLAFSSAVVALLDMSRRLVDEGE